MKKGSQIAIILLILAVISLTIVIIAFHLPRKKDTNTYTMPRTEDPGGLDSESSGCPYWSLTGDQVCDDEANTEECHFDHGDCCDVQNDFSLCSDCFCHSAGHLVNDTLTLSNPPHTPAQLSWISWGAIRTCSNSASRLHCPLFPKITKKNLLSRGEPKNT